METIFRNVWLLKVAISASRLFSAEVKRDIADSNLWGEQATMHFTGDFDDGERWELGVDEIPHPIFGTPGYLGWNKRFLEWVAETMAEVLQQMESAIVEPPRLTAVTRQKLFELALVNSYTYLVEVFPAVDALLAELNGDEEEISF